MKKTLIIAILFIIFFGFSNVNAQSEVVLSRSFRDQVMPVLRSVFAGKKYSSLATKLLPLLEDDFLRILITTAFLKKDDYSHPPIIQSDGQISDIEPMFYASSLRNASAWARANDMGIEPLDITGMGNYVPDALLIRTYRIQENLFNLSWGNVPNRLPNFKANLHIAMIRVAARLPLFILQRDMPFMQLYSGYRSIDLSDSYIKKDVDVLITRIYFLYRHISKMIGKDNPMYYAKSTKGGSIAELNGYLKSSDDPGYFVFDDEGMKSASSLEGLKERKKVLFDEIIENLQRPIEALLTLLEMRYQYKFDSLNLLSEIIVYYAQIGKELGYLSSADLSHSRSNPIQWFAIHIPVLNHLKRNAGENY